MKNAPGFIAALDQSGGSTPKALKIYGIDETSYTEGEVSMYDCIHTMRTRIITSEAFCKDSRVIAAILFEDTTRRKINGIPTAKFLWEEKGIVPILKIDQGLAPLENGVQLMKPMPKLEGLLKLANENNVFGTKERSVIKEANKEGIKAVVEQQFEVGLKVIGANMVPILEPEVDINSPAKSECEAILRDELIEGLNKLKEDEKVMIKLSIPTEENFYKPLIEHPNVVRVVALSGGYPKEEANTLLSKNEGLIASFSRALTEGLQAGDSDEEFNSKLDASISGIYAASI